MGIDLWGLLWQAVSFGLLVFLLYKFLYRPTLNTIDERAEAVRRGAQDAERARQRADEAEQDFDRIMAEASRRSQETLAEAARSSEKVREEIRDQAGQEAARIIQEARQQIEIEQKQALVAVRNQIVDLSIDVARRVLQNGLDESLQRRLIEVFVAEVGDQNEG